MVVGEIAESCEVVVIGGGPGGYLAAIRLAQLGRDVILVEEEERLGGVCLNEGCIPSKALIHAADLAVEARAAHRMGIDVEGVAVDMPRMIAWKDEVVAKLTQGVAYLVEKNGAERIQGRATFLSAKRLAVSTAHGPVYVDFKSAVIATGSSPRALPGFPQDGQRVIGSTEALSLDRVPPQLVVLGAGTVGLELAAVYAKLGSKVSVLELADALLPSLDPEVARALSARLRVLGVSLHLGTRAEELRSLPAGGEAPLEVLARPAGTQGASPRADELLTIPADLVLVSVGRVPNSADLGLDKLGVATDAQGFISVDERQQTSQPHIYAIGDVVGGPLLAHKAYREAKVAAEVIAGGPAAFDNLVIPAVVYTDPEIAWAGLSEGEARAQGFEVLTGSFPFRASGRALTLNAAEGFVKTIADASTKRILGITIVGKDAGELIGEAALAIEMGAFLDDLSQTIHPHPSLSEAILESVEAALGEAIHIVNP